MFLVTPATVTRSATIGVVIQNRPTSVQRPPVRLTAAWPSIVMGIDPSASSLVSVYIKLSLTPLLLLLLESVIGFDFNKGMLAFLNSKQC